MQLGSCKHLNILSHWLQLKGRSPVWICWCSCRPEEPWEVTEHKEHLYLQTFVSYTYDITEWQTGNDSYWINILNCLSLFLKHNTAVTIQVKFELYALREYFVAHVTLNVGPVLCDVPCQELGSQEHLAAYWTLQGTLGLPIQQHVPGMDTSNWLTWFCNVNIW